MSYKHTNRDVKMKNLSFYLSDMNDIIEVTQLSIFALAFLKKFRECYSVGFVLSRIIFNLIVNMNNFNSLHSRYYIEFYQNLKFFKGMSVKHNKILYALLAQGNLCISFITIRIRSHGSLRNSGIWCKNDLVKIFC
jgi:hypothetical protein